MKRSKIGFMIAQARERAQLSQNQLALKIGRSQTCVSQIESGEKRPSLATLLVLTRWLPELGNLMLKELGHESQALSMDSQVKASVMTIPIWEFKDRCLMEIKEEQSKPLPDNFLVSLLCEAVRLAMEYETLLRSRAQKRREPVEDGVVNGRP
jgi:DNA-binding XRE family transcriptional regulator